MHYIDTPKFNFNLIAGFKPHPWHGREKWDVAFAAAEKKRLHENLVRPMHGGMMGAMQVMIGLMDKQGAA